MTTSTSSLNSAVLKCAVAGDLTSTTVAEFRQVLDKTFSESPVGWNTLMLDLSSCKILDSVGLNLLVGTVKRAKGQGASVKVTTSHPMVRRILTFTRLDQHVEIVNA